MVLPPELYAYADNLYRRFPEEFVALGMPGLEEVYDLRPSGSWSRCMFESPSEKRVEITLRRWQPLPMAPAATPLHYAPPYAHHTDARLPPLQAHMTQALAAQPWASRPAAYGGAPAPAEWQALAAPAAAAPSPTASVEEVLRFNRLESALNKLKEQVQVILEVQERVQSAPAPAPTQRVAACEVQQPRALAAWQPAAAAAAAQNGFWTSDAPAAGAAAAVEPKPAAVEPAASGAGLASRRNVLREHLQINTTPTKVAEKAKSGLQPLQVQASNSAPPVVIQIATPDPGVDEETADEVSKSKSGGSAADRRPRPETVATQRMARDSADPESPRSPGRFTPWGK